MRLIIRIEVVLPLPLVPMNTMNSPSLNVRFRESTAIFPPGNRLVRFLNSIMVSPLSIFRFTNVLLYLNAQQSLFANDKVEIL